MGVVALCLEPLSVALGSVSHWIPELELVLGIVFLWCPILGVALGVVLDFVFGLWALGILFLWCPILGVALAAVLGFVFLAPADLGVVLGVALLRIQKTQFFHELINQRPQDISLSQTQPRQLACPKSIKIVTNRVPVAPFELKLGQNESYSLQEPF